MLTFYHCNHSVLDIDRSVAFYEKFFGLKKYRDITAYEGSLRLVFMRDSRTEFRLELTWNRDHIQPYNLGEREFHVAFYSDNFEKDLEQHKEAGIVVSEDKENSIYFIQDPDGYMVEVVKKP